MKVKKKGSTKSTLSRLSPTQFPLTTPLKPSSSLLICPGFLYANVSRYLNESFSFLSYFPQKPSQSFLLLNHFCALEHRLVCSLPAFGAAGLATLPLLLHPMGEACACAGIQGTGTHTGKAPTAPSEAPGQNGEGHPEGPVGLRCTLTARDSIDPGWRSGSWATARKVSSDLDTHEGPGPPPPA